MRLDRVAEELEEPLKALKPGLERLAVVLEDPIVEELPDTLRKVQRDVLPVLTTLGSVAPDLHDLLSVSRDLNELLGKIPGMGRLKRRVEEEEDEEDDEVEDRPG